MILLIDAGNTRLKWGLCNTEPACAGIPEVLADGWCDYASVDRLPATVQQAWSQHPAAAPLQIQRILIANVAGDTIKASLEQAFTVYARPIEWQRSQAACCGVVNHYEQPERLGVDRWAALIGARTLTHSACLVVTAGTATTLDVLDANGHFQGGHILPGEQLMRRALANNTAQLPFAEGAFQLTPRNTADAISSGCLLAQVGAIEHVFAQLPFPADAICLLNGGDAAKLAPHLSIPLRRVNNLVLQGLARIAHASAPDRCTDPQSR